MHDYLYKLSIKSPEYEKYSILSFPSKHFHSRKQLMEFCNRNIALSETDYYLISVIDVDDEEVKYNIKLSDFI